MAIKYLENAEKRGIEARQKYGAMTISEILSRIIIFTLIGYFVIVVICILLYLSPANDRLLSTILLIFVLCEMLTEYALWAFTYQGMRKTEAPLADLQGFATITKEGWRRAEMVLDWTAPIFAALDDIFKRSGLDWRNKPKDNKLVEVVPAPPPEVLDVLKNISCAIDNLATRIEKIEKKE